MDKEFFNPYSLVKKKAKDDSNNYLANLKKKQVKLNTPTPMDQERLPQSQKAQVLNYLGDPHGPASKIARQIRAFLQRRRILRSVMSEFQGKVSDLETMLLKSLTARNTQFLEEGPLVELFSLAVRMWISGLKSVFLSSGDKKKKTESDLRTLGLSLIFRLNDLILLSFNKSKGRQPLLMYLLLDQSTNFKLFLSVIQYLKIVRRVDGSLDYISHLSAKRAIDQLYFTLFDTEELILNNRLLQFNSSSIDLVKMFYEETIEKQTIHKTIATSMYQYLKTYSTDSQRLVRGFILGCFIGHFLEKVILKSDPSYISPQKVQNNLVYSFECCFGYPLLGQFYEVEILPSPKIGQVFYDLLEKIPSTPISDLPAVSFDSKLNMVVNLIYLLSKLVEDPNTQELILRTFGEFFDANIETYITRNFFVMVLETFSGNQAYNYINKSISLAYSSNVVKRIFTIISEGVFDKQTKMLLSKFLIYMLHLAKITGNNTIYFSGVMAVASNNQWMSNLFRTVTKGLKLGELDPSAFDTADISVDLDIGSFALFLEVFSKFLITSEFSWEKTEKIMDKKTMVSFIVFLKNMLLSTYIQNYLMDLKSVYFQYTFDVGSETLSYLNEINEETPFVEAKYFKARSDQMDILQNIFALIPEMNEEQINRQIEILKKLPFCYPFEVKYYLFNEILKSLRSHNISYSEMEIKIRRDHFVADSIEAFKQLKGNTKMLRGRIKVCFMDELGTYESGIDTGGILKEYLYDLAKHLLNPAYGLFMETRDRELDPNPMSREVVGEDHLTQFYICGVAIGRAIYEEILIDSVFSKIMLRRMLGKPNSFNHLMLYDPDLYEQLKKVKNYAGNVEELGLTFSTNTKGGSHEEIELVKGGSNLPVTNENKIRYIYYLTHYFLNVKTREQSKAFLSGIKEIIPLSVLQIFTTRELQILISGEDAEINITDLQNNTVYSGGFTPADHYVKEFWKVLRSFSSEDKVKFLRFVTNCRRPPVFGFRNLTPKFTLLKLEAGEPGREEARLPISSTCFNTLKLPIYTSSETMHKKLIQAINSGSGYYII